MMEHANGKAEPMSESAVPAKETASRAKRPRRWLRRLGCAALLGSFLLLGLVWVASDPLLRAGIEEGLGQKLGVPARIGSVRLSLLGRPSLTLHEVTLGADAFLQVGEATVSLAGWGALHGEAAVFNVDAVGLTCTVPAADAAGAAEWQALLDTLLADSGAPDTPWSMPELRLRGFALRWPGARGEAAELAFTQFAITGLHSGVTEGRAAAGTIELREFALTEDGEARVSLERLTSGWGHRDGVVFLGAGGASDPPLALSTLSINEALRAPGRLRSHALLDALRARLPAPPAAGQAAPNPAAAPARALLLPGGTLDSMRMVITDRVGGAQKGQAQVECEKLTFDSLDKRPGAPWRLAELTAKGLSCGLRSPAGSLQVGGTATWSEPGNGTREGELQQAELAVHNRRQQAVLALDRRAGAGTVGVRYSEAGPDGKDPAVLRLRLSYVQPELVLHPGTGPAVQQVLTDLVAHWQQAFGIPPQAAGATAAAPPRPSLALLVEDSGLSLRGTGAAAGELVCWLAVKHLDAIDRPRTENGSPRPMLRGRGLQLFLARGQNRLLDTKLTALTGNLPQAGDKGALRAEGLRADLGAGPSGHLTWDTCALEATPGPGALFLLDRLHWQTLKLNAAIEAPGRFPAAAVLRAAGRLVQAYLPAGQPGEGAPAPLVLPTPALTLDLQGTHLTIEDRTRPADQHTLDLQFDTLQTSPSDPRLRLTNLLLKAQNQGRKGLRISLAKADLPSPLAAGLATPLDGALETLQVQSNLQAQMADRPSYLVIDRISATGTSLMPLHSDSLRIERPRLHLVREQTDGWALVTRLQILQQSLDATTTALALAVHPQARPTGPPRPELPPAEQPRPPPQPVLTLGKVVVVSPEGRFEATGSDQPASAVFATKAAVLTEATLFHGAGHTGLTGGALVAKNSRLAGQLGKDRTVSVECATTTLGKLDTLALSRPGGPATGLTLEDVALAYGMANHPPAALLQTDRLHAAVRQVDSRRVALAQVACGTATSHSHIDTRGQLDAALALDTVTDLLAAFGPAAKAPRPAGAAPNAAPADPLEDEARQAPFCLTVDDLRLDRLDAAVEDAWSVRPAKPVTYRLERFWFRGQYLSWGEGPAGHTATPGLLVGAGRLTGQTGEDLLPGRLALAIDRVSGLGTGTARFAAEGRASPAVDAAAATLPPAAGGEDTSRPTTPKALGLQVEAMPAGLVNPAIALLGLQFRGGEGTIDIDLHGHCRDGELDLPLGIAFHQVRPIRFSAPQISISKQLANAITLLLDAAKYRPNLPLPGIARLVGPLDAPSVKVNTPQLTDLLAKLLPDLVKQLTGGREGEQAKDIEAIREATEELKQDKRKGALRLLELGEKLYRKQRGEEEPAPENAAPADPDAADPRAAPAPDEVRGLLDRALDQDDIAPVEDGPVPQESEKKQALPKRLLEKVFDILP